MCCCTEALGSLTALKIFLDLPAEEKKYWHSHKHEVESGLLQLQVLPHTAMLRVCTHARTGQRPRSGYAGSRAYASI
jgi:hypothetical protein